VTGAPAPAAARSVAVHRRSSAQARWPCPGPAGTRSPPSRWPRRQPEEWCTRICTRSAAGCRSAAASTGAHEHLPGGSPLPASPWLDPPAQRPSRLSDIGFSLITAPLLVLLSGPRDGVALTNLLSIVVALAVLANSASHLDSARLRVLPPPGWQVSGPAHWPPAGCPAGRCRCVDTASGPGLAAVIVASWPQPPGSPGGTWRYGSMGGIIAARSGCSRPCRRPRRRPSPGCRGFPRACPGAASSR
jgi:hypothetical protein